jgi:hypothetical protein
VQLHFTVSDLKPISKGHSFHHARAPYKYLYGGVPYKSPKIAENRRKSELQADLRGSLILLPTVKSNAQALQPYSLRLRYDSYRRKPAPIGGVSRVSVYFDWKILWSCM